MNIPWDKIIEVAVELIQECLARGIRDNEIDDRLANPEPGDYLRMRSRLRRHHNIKGKELRQVMREIRIKAGCLPADVRVLLLEEAKED